MEKLYYVHKKNVGIYTPSQREIIFVLESCHVPDDRVVSVDPRKIKRLAVELPNTPPFVTIVDDSNCNLKEISILSGCVILPKYGDYNYIYVGENARMTVEEISTDILEFNYNSIMRIKHSINTKIIKFNSIKYEFIAETLYCGEIDGKVFVVIDNYITGINGLYKGITLPFTAKINTEQSIGLVDMEPGDVYRVLISAIKKATDETPYLARRYRRQIKKYSLMCEQHLLRTTRIPYL